jgi:hypothetical protein
MCIPYAEYAGLTGLLTHDKTFPPPPTVEATVEAPTEPVAPPPPVAPSGGGTAMGTLLPLSSPLLSSETDSVVALIIYGGGQAHNPVLAPNIMIVILGRVIAWEESDALAVPDSTSFCYRRLPCTDKQVV